MRDRELKPLTGRERELAALDARLLGVRRALSLLATAGMARRDPGPFITAAFAEVERARVELRILADAEAELVVNRQYVRAKD